MIRTKNQKRKVEDKFPFHYYAVINDMSSSEMDYKKFFRFYHKRSQVKNYIKDLKRVMDFFDKEVIRIKRMKNKFVLKVDVSRLRPLLK